MWHCNSIFLNLTNLCNVRCKKCITPLIVKKRGELSKNMLFTIMRLLEANGFSGLIRCGLGENLIYSYLEELFRFLSANTKKFRFDILTNGLAFNVNKEIYFTNQAVRWGITLDGMEQDDVEDLQYGLDVDRVKNNLFQIRKKFPSCNMYLNYTLHNKNMQHLSDFVKMGITLGVKQLFVTPLKVFENNYTEFLAEYIPDLSLPSTISIFSKIKHMAIQHGVRLLLPENSYSPEPCAVSGKYSPVIDIDGKVSFCSGQESARIGNVTNPDIASIWEKLRKKTDGGEKLSKFCSNCVTIKNQSKTIFEMPKL